MPNYFCPTCLSQGRKMFPFPLNYTKLPFSTFYKDLKLTTKDMVCWECRSFILKMAAFRHKALRAQADLAVWGNKPWTTLQSLSKLAISKGINLDILDSPEEPDPLILDKVKTETDIGIEPDDNEFAEENYEMGNVKDEMFDVNTETGDVNNEMDSVNNDTCDVNNETGDVNNEMDSVNNEMCNVNNETGDVNNEMDCVNNEMGNEHKDVIFQVFCHKTCVAPKSNKQKVKVDVTNDGYVANATLMSLLTRKSSLPFPPPPNDTTSKESISDYKIEINAEKHPRESTNKPEPKDSQIITNNFTEETLTEEEMRRWWEGKRENEFYANSIPVFQCEKCVEPFFTRRSFLGHQKMHTEMYGELSCDICALRFSTESVLAAHKGRHYRLLKCAHCAHKWDSPNSMRRHCNTEHRIPVTEWNCDVCARQLPSHGRYLNHIKGHCYESCPDCGRKVNTINMKTHMLTHDTSSEKKYECADCGSKFRTKELVRTHILRMHNTKADGAFCVDCNRQFRNMTSYKTHMKFATKHVAPELLRHKCGECPRTFVSRALLRRHVETKHSEQRNYPCQVCSARFRSATARTRHRRVTHEGYVAPRDNMCDNCGKSFQTKAQLSIHMNTHTGARPFVCALCGADFGHKSALYLHGRYKHKIQKKRGGKKDDNTGS